jgi:glutamate racemase
MLDEWWRFCEDLDLENLSVIGPSIGQSGGAFPWNRANLGRAPIGVFDSGVGGLTVLREIYRQLPQESVLYFGDTARLPYGTRSAAEIQQFVREILIWMGQRGVKMVVMACNTSSALALEQVQREFNIPILGVILPGARAAVQQGQRIGVISTPATTASNAYKQAIQEISPSAQVWQIACPEFVPIIEQGRIHEPRTRQIAADYLAPLIDAEIDTLIYGCTHYPHLAPVLRALLPPAVQLVDPAVQMAVAVGQELDLLGLRNTQEAMPTAFFVSGNPAPFVTIAQQWLGFTPMVETVTLPQLSPPVPVDQVVASN